MIHLSFDTLADISGGRLVRPDHAGRCFTGVSIDSRTIKENELFVAVSGESFDGHSFIEKAMQQGAAGALVKQTWLAESRTEIDLPLVAVEDSHGAMITLAKNYRDSIPARWIAVTGSNGKTTTKEITYHLISQVEPETWRSPGNFNNLFGIPLSIFAMPSSSKIALLELGISEPGEMSRLAQLVRPDLAILTNVGPSHLEQLGTIDAVADEKLELIRGASSQSAILYNGDDKLLKRKVLKLRPDAVSFGLGTGLDFSPECVVADKDGASIVTIGERKFVLPLFWKTSTLQSNRCLCRICDSWLFTR